MKEKKAKCLRCGAGPEWLEEGSPKERKKSRYCPAIHYGRVHILRFKGFWELRIEGSPKVVARSREIDEVMKAALRQTYYDGKSDGIKEVVQTIEIDLSRYKALSRKEE